MEMRSSKSWKIKNRESDNHLYIFMINKNRLHTLVDLSRFGSSIFLFFIIFSFKLKGIAHESKERK